MLKQIIVLLPFVLLYVGCSPVYYVPDTQNVPLLTKESDTFVSLHLVGNSDKKTGLQGAYAVTDNIGLQLNGSLFSVANDKNGNGGNGGLINVGAGYFFCLANHLVFDCYALVGYGEMENHFAAGIDEFSGDPLSNVGSISSRFATYCVQPSFGFTSRWFDIAASVKFSGVSYFNITGNLVYNNINQVHYLRSHGNQLFVEPALTVRAGYAPIKVQFQIGMSRNLMTHGFPQHEHYTSFGLIYNRM